MLITLSDLRADLVGSLGGEPGWTPELDRFKDEAGWSGRAVTSSSSPVPSAVSLATGVDPWQHGVLSHLFFKRRLDLPTMAEMLGAEGFSTSLFAPKGGAMQFGAFDGFESVHELGSGDSAIESLRGLSGDPEFLWIHLPYAGFPLQDRRLDVPGLADRATPSRKLLHKPELLTYADPGKPLPEDLQITANELYRHGVAWADFQLGRYLQALRDSGRMDDSLVVVTAFHGTELGEQGQMLFAQNLSRESIEVPLMIRWPDSRVPRADPGPVAQARLWATVAEVIGRAPRPVHLHSLDRESRLPILSSLYLHDAANRFTLVTREGGDVIQITSTIQFAPSEPLFFAAQVAESEQRRSALQKTAQRLRRRLLGRFRDTLPLSGLARSNGWDLERNGAAVLGDSHTASRLRIDRWTGGSGTEPMESPELESRLKTMLEDRWRRFVDEERTPREEQQRWAR